MRRVTAWVWATEQNVSRLGTTTRRGGHWWTEQRREGRRETAVGPVWASDGHYLLLCTQHVFLGICYIPVISCQRILYWRGVWWFRKVLKCLPSNQSRQKREASNKNHRTVSVASGCVYGNVSISTWGGIHVCGNIRVLCCNKKKNPWLQMPLVEAVQNCPGQTGTMYKMEGLAPNGLYWVPVSKWFFGFGS